jgi:hypothetical protein
LQFAIEEEQLLQAAEIVKQDFYMDNLLTGCKTIQEAIKLRTELQELLNKGGFSLRKWCSISSEVLQTIPPEDRTVQPLLKLNDKHSVKTLGLVWHPSLDKCKFEINMKSQMEKITKRSVMSAIASIFDPLGLQGPAIITCKIFMQQLWKLNITWDEEHPLEYKSQWNLIHEQIPKLNEVQINRKVIGCGEISNIQVHGFSDASERAYAACVYIRSVNESGEVTVNLLSAKSSVAPYQTSFFTKIRIVRSTFINETYLHDNAYSQFRSTAHSSMDRFNDSPSLDIG